MGNAQSVNWLLYAEGCAGGAVLSMALCLFVLALFAFPRGWRRVGISLICSLMAAVGVVAWQIDFRHQALIEWLLWGTWAVTVVANEVAWRALSWG